MRIMKFGGSSLNDAAAIRHVAEVVSAASQEQRVIVVVSAISGVTDVLLEAAQSALDCYDRAMELFAELHRLHILITEELIPPSRRSAITAQVQLLFNNLEDVLHGVHLVRECSTSSRDLIVSYGERLSAMLLAHHLTTTGTDATAVDARPLIRTKGLPGSGMVDLEESFERIRSFMAKAEGLPVVTGYIASNREGVTTTLGRNGSDYTATLVAAAVGADVVELWTDVDGIFTADPSLIKDARVLDLMTFEEAQEMAYFGASIVHPQALQPAAEALISVVVRNTFKPSHPGTRISSDGSLPQEPVRGLTAIDGVALVNVEGSGMIGMLGIAGRLFTALAGSGVNIIMISQASSEHSICFVTRSGELQHAVEAVQETFAAELEGRLIQRIEQMDDLVVLSIIGTRMRGTIGLSGRFFGALGEVGVNVLAISQGSSERNISIVVAETDKLAALKAVHSAFDLGRKADPKAPEP